MNFAVVTKVPPGNVYDDVAVRDELGILNVEASRGEKYNPEKSVRVRIPAFVEGEILVLNEWGREISGIGRKPSKWTIEYEEFPTIDEAIKRAIEVSGG